MTTTQTTETAKCTRCGRTLTDPTSIAAGLGPVCRRHVHNAANVIDLSAFRDAKAASAKATELIEQAGIVAGPARGLYLAPSTDGAGFYLIDTAAGSCTCKGHMYSGRCYHSVAAAIITARPTAAFAAAA
jgi:hypothetical protein